MDLEHAQTRPKKAKCYSCGEDGHFSYDWRAPKQPRPPARLNDMLGVNPAPVQLVHDQGS